MEKFQSRLEKTTTKNGLRPVPQPQPHLWRELRDAGDMCPHMVTVAAPCGPGSPFHLSEADRAQSRRTVVCFLGSAGQCPAL